jgi:hypothetical protein
MKIQRLQPTKESKINIKEASGCSTEMFKKIERKRERTIIV